MAAPMRLIAATVALHDPPLAPPPWALNPERQHGSANGSVRANGALPPASSFVPDMAGYSTAAAQGAAHISTPAYPLHSTLVYLDTVCTQCVPSNVCWGWSCYAVSLHMALHFITT